jgi:RNA polymerase sigma factor (sigma-70 family)
MGVHDAVQAGFLGLLRAAELWDEQRNVSFTTYAFQSIKTEILKEAMRGGVIVIPLWVFVRESGKPYRSIRCRSLPEGEDEGPWWEPLSRQDRIDTEDYEAVLTALENLPSRERDVVTRCVLGGESLRAVGRDLGLTGERIRQIRERGLGRLRRTLRACSPNC